MSVLSYYRRSYFKPLIAGGLVTLAAYGIYWITPAAGWGGLILAAGLVAAAYLPLVYLLAMDSYDRNLFHDMLAKIAERFRSISLQKKVPE